MTRGAALVTGAAGILGDALLRSPQFADAVGTTHRTAAPHRTVSVDLADAEEVSILLERLRPRTVVHTVGLTDVDACERDVGAAFGANVRPALNLANWIREHSPTTLLVYVSSDQVYSDPGPHAETDVRPINVYGFSKLAGELAAMQAPRHLVLRTNFYGRSRGARASFTDWIADAVADGRRMTLHRDAVFSVLHLVDLVGLIAECVDRGLEGVYNLTSRDAIAKVDFARVVAEIFRPAAGDLVDAVSETAPGRAPRPLDLALDVSRIQEVLGRELPTIADGLEHLRAERWTEVVRA